MKSITRSEDDRRPSHGEDAQDGAPVKIRDVAAAAGVSTATVSRVLNGAENVVPETRTRVEEAVARLGYRGNRLASNLRRRKAATIGVLVADIENPHFTEMVRAVEDAAFSRGYRVILCNTDEAQDKQSAYLRLLAAERVSGAVIVPSPSDDPEIVHLLDLGIHVVAFDRAVADPRADLVAADSATATARATTHLLDAGHRAIALVGGPVDVPTGRDRRAGYERVMREAGLEPRVADGHFRFDGGREATLELLAAGDLTALVFANNLMTAGGLRAIREQRLRIPQDVAVVAIDDPFWAQLVEPPLTTLAQPVRAMADSAVELMFERLDGQRHESRRIVFDFELRVRGSSVAREDAGWRE
jgi:LacI family transcriptional regulator